MWGIVGILIVVLIFALLDLLNNPKDYVVFLKCHVVHVLFLAWMFCLFGFCLSKLLSDKDRASFDACASAAQRSQTKERAVRCGASGGSFKGFILAPCHDFLTYMFERQMVQVLAGTEYTRISIQLLCDGFDCFEMFWVPQDPQGPCPRTELLTLRQEVRRRIWRTNCRKVDANGSF